MIKGLVSVIIPTFNRIDRLLKRIEEIQNQSYSNWEIIVVDDGSTDDTVRKIVDFCDTSKIKIISLFKNSGCCSIPRNIGISWSNGEFISPSDDDVIIKPEKFELLVKALNNNPNAILSYGDRQDNTEGSKDFKLRQNKKWNPEYLDRPVDNSQFIYRSEAYKKISFVYSWNADDLHLAKALYKLGGFIYVEKVVSIYVWHKTNRSLNKPSEDKIKELNKNIGIKVKEYENYLNKNYRKDL